MPTLAPATAALALARVTWWLNDLSTTPHAAGLSAEQCTDLQLLLTRMGRYAPSGANNRFFIGAAYELGIPCLPLPGGVYQYGWGTRGKWLDSSFTESTSAISGRLARHKAVTNALLQRAGIPVPAHRLVVSADAAVEVAAALGYPVVVKPASQDGGVGVSAGLESEREVRTAFGRAREYATDVLVEKHVLGNDYRVYVFRERAVWALERTPAGVTGDGTRTVEQLVAIANQDPRRGDASWALMARIELDEEALELLAGIGMTPDSAPEVDRFIRLRRAANVSSGGTPVGVVGKMHPDNARLCERATQVLRLDLAGIDLLMPDIARSWRQTGGAICEVNARPQLSGVTSPHIFGQLLREVVTQQGRIPIALVLTTGADLHVVEEIAELLAQRGLCVGTSSSVGLRIGANRIRDTAGSAFQDARALLIDSSVDAAVISTNGKELLSRGLPVDQFDALVVGDWALSADATSVSRSAAALRATLSLLRPHCAGNVFIARDHADAHAVSVVMGQRRVHVVPSALDLPTAAARALLR